MDLDGDGHLDAISGTYAPGHIWFYKGTKTGFAEREQIEEELDEAGDTETSGRRKRRRWMACTNFCDWDGDGDLDMVIGSVTGHVFVNVNEGTKTAFRFGKRVPLQVHAGDGKTREMKVCQKSDPLPVDWDGDGVLDILVGDEASQVTFFRGRSDRTFEAGVSLWTGERVDAAPNYRDMRAKLRELGLRLGYRLRLAATDWNNDGKLDLLVGNCYSTTVPGKDRPSRRTEGHVYLLLRR